MFLILLAREAIFYLKASCTPHRRVDTERDQRYRIRYSSDFNEQLQQRFLEKRRWGRGEGATEAEMKK